MKAILRKRVNQPQYRYLAVHTQTIVTVAGRGGKWRRITIDRRDITRLENVTRERLLYSRVRVATNDDNDIETLKKAALEAPTHFENYVSFVVPLMRQNPGTTKKQRCFLLHH